MNIFTTLRDQLRLEEYAPKYRWTGTNRHAGSAILLKGGTSLHIVHSHYLRVRGRDARTVSEIATLCGWTVLTPKDPDPS